MPKMPNMNQMLKMAQSMAKDMEKKMNDLQVEGNAGGGMVKAVMNGHKSLISLTISPDVVDPDDIEMLQDLVIAAINDAQSKIDEELKDSLGGLPGMPGGFPFG